MSAYTFVMIILGIILVALLWIPLNETFNGSDGIVSALNGLTTDSKVQGYNNTAGAILYYLLFFFIIIGGIYVIKVKLDERGAYA